MYFQFLFVFPRKIKHVNEGDVSYIFHLLSKPKKKKDIILLSYIINSNIKLFF